MKSQKVQRLRVQVYFAADQIKVYQGMEKICQATGLSMSELAYLCIVSKLEEQGLPDSLFAVSSKKPRPRPATKTKKS